MHAQIGVPNIGVLMLKTVGISSWNFQKICFYSWTPPSYCVFIIENTLHCILWKLDLLYGFVCGMPVRTCSLQTCEGRSLLTQKDEKYPSTPPHPKNKYIDKLRNEKSKNKTRQWSFYHIEYTTTAYTCIAYL